MQLDVMYTYLIHGKPDAETLQLVQMCSPSAAIANAGYWAGTVLGLSLSTMNVATVRAIPSPTFRVS